MKCLDNIYTKQIKYNSPVLYQLESLKKEYEKLLKVSNEIIKTGSFIEECYFENQNAVLYDNEITFNGNLKFKTDEGNYFQNIPSSLKLNVQGTGEIVVDVGEDNKTLIFKLDEEFLSEISLMIENLETLSSNFNDLKSDYEILKSKFNSQIFDNFIGIRNTTDSKIDQIKHINNNFLITSNDGTSLLNIDEQLEKIYAFNKELKFAESGSGGLDTIYDKDSQDIEINKGYTSGIKTTLKDGITLSADVSDYDFLLVFFCTNQNLVSNINSSSVIFVDLRTQNYSENDYKYSSTTIVSNLYQGFLSGPADPSESYGKYNVRVNEQKNSINFRSCSFNLNSQTTFDYGRENFYKVLGGKL